MAEITKWQTGIKMGCNLAVNFGYDGEIPFQTISLPNHYNQNFDQYEFEKSYNCYFVFVGGKYVEDLKVIVDIVEDITHHFHGIKPIAMFVMGKFNSFEINNFSSHGEDLTKV